MPTVDHPSRTVFFKIVFYGLPDAGKRTILEAIASAVEGTNLREEEAGADIVTRLELAYGETPEASGYNSVFGLYTLGGKVEFSQNWRMLLQGADGVVIVADGADPEDPRLHQLWEETMQFQELHDIPVAGFANKQDLPGAWGEDRMAATFFSGVRGIPWFDGCATSGERVFGALNEVCQRVFLTDPDLVTPEEAAPADFDDLPQDQQTSPLHSEED